MSRTRESHGGHTTLAFPRLEATAEMLAVGEGLSQGLNALGANPAALFTSRPELLVQFQPLGEETSAGLAGVALPIRPWRSTLAVDYVGFRSTNLDARDAAGNQAAGFGVTDSLVGIYAAFLLKPIQAGVGYKGLRSRISEREAGGHAWDTGLAFQLETFGLGVSLLNAGEGPRFQDEARWPTRWLYSAMYRPWSPLSLVAGYSYMKNEKEDEWSLGLAYTVSEVLVLRGRYRFPGEAKSDPGRLAGGVGFRFSGQALDYTFQPFDGGLTDTVAGRHLITLIFRWGGTGGSR